MPQTNYNSLFSEFHWNIPAVCNMAEEVCLRHSPDGTALICPQDTGDATIWTFGDFDRESAKLANALSGLGLQPGARIAVLLGQCPQTAIAHIAAWRSGMISVPLFALFGPDALQYRLTDSGAQVVIADESGLARLAETDLSNAEVSHIIHIGRDKDGVQNQLPVLSWNCLLQKSSSGHQMQNTAPDTPALLIYTSGTTGPPKGALHGHRVLRGHLPGVSLPHNMFPQTGDLFWTPADWAWIGGLLDVLMPAWFYGVPTVASRAAKFNPEDALSLMAKHQVRNVFFPPTALKLTRASGVKIPDSLALRSVGSGGETLGADMLEWGRSAFALDINEFYGQTECNLILGNCAALFPARPGSMGKTIPGHKIAVIDDQGRQLPDNEEGEIAAHAGGADGKGDPVMFLRYWNNPDATQKKFCGKWLRTGDRGSRDRDGYWSFVGRDDDVISSGGYRIGPGEIENCLLSHPSVALAGIIGVPDKLRGQIIKAVIVPRRPPTDSLAEELRLHVKTRLAAHEYPKLIEFASELPMTATGKIKRAELRKLHGEKSQK